MSNEGRLQQATPHGSGRGLLFLAGPTAVGKSELAMALAERIHGEIVSVDSMQVYRGLDIGTGKPSAEDQARVRHHLINVIGIEESFDAAQFMRLAQEAVTNIQRRSRIPILCGGTGLYFKCFRDGLGAAPPANTALRAQLQATPLSDLLQELAQRDPETFERIDRQNLRRVIRAMEVIRLTGRPFSEQRARWSPGPRERSPGVHWFGLARSREDLRRRIDHRVEEMFRRGLVAETQTLLQRGLGENQTAQQALGYRQVLECLQGKRSLPATIELVKIRTGQYAKRQMTWFRRQLELEWIHLEKHADLALVADRLADRATRGPQAAPALHGHESPPR